jgi:hypothetical protein
MKYMFYQTGKSFSQQKKEADRKHLPLYLDLKLKMCKGDVFSESDIAGMLISAGKLESCKRIAVSEMLNNKLALGRCYRVAGVGNFIGDARIIVKLRWQDSKGYFTGKKKDGEPCEEHIFAIPEDVFLTSVYQDKATQA